MYNGHIVKGNNNSVDKTFFDCGISSGYVTSPYEVKKMGENNDMSVLFAYCEDDFFVLGTDSRAVGINKATNMTFLQRDDFPKTICFDSLDLYIGCIGNLFIDDKEWYVAISELIENSNLGSFSANDIAELISKKLNVYGSDFIIIHNYKMSYLSAKGQIENLDKKVPYVCGEVNYTNPFLKSNTFIQGDFFFAINYCHSLISSAIQIGNIVQSEASKIGLNSLNTCGGKINIVAKNINGIKETEYD